jgi:dTDP-glucose 4,6-dehydratase
MKKIIITGGNGFIGSNLINFLLRKKFFIINIDKNAYSKKSYLLRDIKNVNYKFYKLDINSKKIGNILSKYKPDAIFNLAAETHVDRSIDSPKDFINSNIIGTFNILEQMRNYKKKYKKKIRLINISTD